MAFLPDPQIPTWTASPGRHRLVRAGMCLCVTVVVLASLTRANPARSADPQSPAQAPAQAQAAAATQPPPIELELLQKLPFDKLTLIDNAVFEIEPISPRPLPAFDPSKEKSGTRVPTPEEAAKGANPAQPTQESLDEVIIHLMDGEQRDYKVKRSSIKKIEYFEDMLLAEADRLVLIKNFAKAFEYYLAVQNRNPTWNGLTQKIDKMLFEEGNWALASNDRDKGLRLLRELYDRNPKFQGLLARLGDAYGSRIREAVDAGLYSYARKVLHELTAIDPDGPITRDLTERFKVKARDAMKRAQDAEPGERVDHLALALRIWPKLEEAVAPFEEAFRASPTLEVGVTDLPRPVAPWVNSAASARVTPLLYLPILVDDSEEAQIGKRSGQLAANVELGDLGRRLEISIRPGLRWNDGSRAISSIDLVRAMSDRAQPRSPSYNARWADLLERIETVDADRIAIRLARTPLDPVSLLTLPIGPAHASWDGRVSTAAGRVPVGDGPYAFESQSDKELRIKAMDRSSESDAARAIVPVPKIQRVREIRLPDTNAAIGALARGEIALLEHIPSDHVQSLIHGDEVAVGRYRLPSLHAIAVDGRNPALKNRNLRRAISYAIDRKKILEESVLKHPINDYDRPSDGPFATDSTANAPNIEPLEYNMLVARMLTAGVRRELSLGKIQLNFEYPAIPEAQIAVPKIAESLQALGYIINLIERPESELEEGLRSGRRFDLAYRRARCDQPIREIGPLLCPGYDAAPQSDGLGSISSPRMMQLLLQLEHATDYEQARNLVLAIDRESRDELPIIPLWQLADHFAYRPALKGPADVADHLYQGIETWEIAPWFAKDPW